MSSVDVIVPCYRYGHFLEECVTSVLTQEGPTVRVLVIDDASPDNSGDVAKTLAARDPRVTARTHAMNQGHIATYNEGIEWVSADYYLLLSADDYLLPGALNRAVAVLDANPEASFSIGPAIELQEDGRTIPVVLEIPATVRHQVLDGSEFVEISGVRNIVRTPTAVVRTQVQKRLGGYRNELPHSGDMEMWLRLASFGSVAIVNESQAVYRRHRRNMSLEYNRLLDLRQRKAALDIFFEFCIHRFKHADVLQRKLAHLLATESVWAASAAFNDGEFATSDQLTQFAVEGYPTIRRSIPWFTLAGKKFLGPRACSVLRSAMGRS